jgi:hypothetical protein
MSDSNMGNRLTTMLMTVDWSIVLCRLIPYWITIGMSLWILAFLYLYTSEDATTLYINGLTTPVRILFLLDEE